MYDVISLTMNNYDELTETLGSLVPSKEKIAQIIIVYDGVKPLISNIGIDKEMIGKTILIKGANEGIYSAMNIALGFVKNDFLFINSGDKLIGAPLLELGNTSAPFSFSCCTKELVGTPSKFFPNRLFKKFNHNSIIFPKKFVHKYDINFKISADYDLILRLEQEHGWPISVTTKGYLLYDLNGISSIKKASRDLEYFKISKLHKKYVHALYFYLKYCLNRIKGFS